MSQTITQGRLRIDARAVYALTPILNVLWMKKFANFKRFVDEEVLPGVELDFAWRGTGCCRVLAQC